MPLLPSEYSFSADIRRGAKGKQVRFIQEWLTLNGTGTGIDSDFGPATEAAVRLFQQKRKLPATGAVDRATFDALTAPVHAALKPIAAGSKTLGQLVVAYAQQHLRQHPREAGGQNRGPWVRLYMKGKEGNAWPWCAGFVSYILAQAAGTLGRKPPVKYTFSCDQLAAFAKGAQVFLSEKDIRSGKAPTPGSVFLVRKRPGDWTHTGLVVSVDNEHFETIEGNTNDAGDREGYEVCRRTRSYIKKDFMLVQ